MRFTKLIGLAIILLGLVGYGAYHYVTEIASEKVINSVSKELETSGDVKKLQKKIESDPELKSFVETGSSKDDEKNEPEQKSVKAQAADQEKSTNQEKLPFKTKEDAVKTVIKKVGISNLNNIKTKVENGKMSKQAAFNEVESKLTKQEVLALKVIAYKELNKNNK